MPLASQAAPVSKKMLWTGRVMSVLVVLFLLFHASLKLLRLAPALEATARLGYPVSVVFPLGIVLLACTVLYAIPRTSLLGAILVTAYLGGAVATNVRVSNPLFGYILFPVYLALLLWGGLYLRDERLRALIPAKGDVSHS